MISQTMPPINSRSLRISLLAALSLALPGTLGCVMRTNAVAGSGNRVSERRPVGEPFDTVELLGSATVVVRVDPDAEPAVTVTTDDNLLSHVETQIAGGKLRIQTQGWINPTRGVRVDVVAPRIGMALLSGSGDLIASGIDSHSLRVELHGSGDLRLGGRAGDLVLELSGSGDIDARDLVSQNAHARLSGSGEIILHATHAADLEVSGSGDIHCLGNPQQRNTHVSGSGDIDIR